MRDRLAAVVFGILVVSLSAAMPAWRWIGKPPPVEERYATTADDFAQRVAAMTAAHATGEMDDEVPVVRPPAGDIYLLARRFGFSPVLELEVGKHYRLHVATIDVLHGLNLPLGGTDLLLLPGQAVVLPLTPTREGYHAVQCSEYCGLRHSRMKSHLRVVAPGADGKRK
ncbi:MAG: quinol oxidase [Alphaproteobacteria bacterium]